MQRLKIKIETTYCYSCSEKVSEDSGTISPKGHGQTYDNEEEYQDATCTDEGSYYNVSYCSICNEEVDRTPVTIQAKGHGETYTQRENVIEATETTDGSYDEVTYCHDCNKEIDRQSYTVSATGTTQEITTSEIITLSVLGAIAVLILVLTPIKAIKDTNKDNKRDIEEEAE